MLFSKSALLAVAMLGASVVDAHMKMAHPVPYSDDTLNKSPLAADGSDFPCKLRPNAFQPPAQENIMKIGEPQLLDFIGSAVHGGGSCQISLTTDLEPTKQSNWMVIQSYEGGCPAKAEGNLSHNNEAQFHFTIPDGISPGKYTLAWTWLNRVGNREFYMNCAPITVVGGSSKREVEQPKALEKRSSFPNMFVANINGCMTTEGYDIRFPNPGDALEKLGDPKNLQPAGQPACKGTPSWEPGSGSGSSSGGSGSGSGSSSSDPAPSPTSAPSLGFTVIASIGPAPTSSDAPGVFIPEDSSTSAPESSAPAPTPEPSTPAPAPEPTEAPTPEPSEPSTSEPSTSGGSGEALTGACDTEGTWNCIGGTSFQRCANGQWTPAQQMAAGTECKAGQTQELKIAASARSVHASQMRHRRAHGRIHA